MKYFKKFKKAYLENKKFDSDGYLKTGCILSMIIGITFLLFWIAIMSTSMFNDLSRIFSDHIWNAFSLVIILFLNAINILFNVKILLGVQNTKAFAILSTVIIGGILPIFFIIFGKYKPVK